MLYLDNAATTPLSEDLKKYIISLLDMYGNPSSKYSVGTKVRKIINDSRRNVAGFINASEKDVYFTSGGSAANTMCVRGYVTKNECDILYSPIAHKSIIECVKSISSKSTPIPVNKNGEIIISELERLCMCSKKPFVIIDHVNSELGIIQDLKSIVDVVHFYKGIVYTDCTGSVSTIPIDVQSLDIDMCGFSGHKIGALKGTGVVYKKPEICIEPLVYGTQENGLMGGTENVLGIASLGYAISKFKYNKSSLARDYVYEYILNNIDNSYLVGGLKNRTVHNLYVCFKGVDSESLMLSLDLYDIQVSMGSACNSNEVVASHVLQEINIDKEDLFSCIRITFSGNETKDDLDYFCEKLNICVKQLREIK